jgi:hypothetical protein
VSHGSTCPAITHLLRLSLHLGFWWVCVRACAQSVHGQLACLELGYLFQLPILVTLLLMLPRVLLLVLPMTVLRLFVCFARQLMRSRAEC